MRSRLRADTWQSPWRRRLRRAPRQIPFFRFASSTCRQILTKSSSLVAAISYMRLREHCMRCAMSAIVREDTPSTISNAVSSLRKTSSVRRLAMYRRLPLNVKKRIGKDGNSTTLGKTPRAESHHFGTNYIDTVPFVISNRYQITIFSTEQMETECGPPRPPCMKAPPSRPCTSLHSRRFPRRQPSSPTRKPSPIHSWKHSATALRASCAPRA